MRISIVRTDKKNADHLSVKTIEWFLERIQTDTKAGDIGKLRAYIANFGDTGGYETTNPVAMIHPSVEMAKSQNGILEVTAFSGLVWLHVAGLMKADEVEAVKEASKIMPTTLAAFKGADGRSAEILVSVARKGQSAPPIAEDEISRLCQSAYDIAFGAYSGVLPRPIERQAATARSCFRMTLDPKPYYNPKATPLLIQTLPSEEAAGQRDVAHDSQERQEILGTDMSLYAVYEQMYERASEEAYEETTDIPEPRYYLAYITALARRLCEMGVPQEEAFLHIANHHVYKSQYNEDEFRAIVQAVYAETKPKARRDEGMVSSDTRRLISFLNTRYVFRFNTVMGYTEYRPNNTWLQDWSPCDENAINGITIEARLANLDVRDKDVRRYVRSNKIRKTDPIGSFLVRASDKWDGKTDHIAMLARCVPCDIPQWELWFKKWFVSMVAQWIMPHQEYGNAIVPLLISPQGDGKTTFCRMLLPKELRWGFLENLDVSEKRATLQAMHNFLLINLDEFNQISPKLQEGFLKNVIQLPNVKIKRPYGKHVEEFKRFASFIATTNELNVLSDPTGSRRFICVNLTGPVNTDYKPNYEALYGQAYNIVINREMDWWFGPDEVSDIMAHNRQYQVTPAAILYFNEYFEPAASEEEGQWLSPTAIYQELRLIYGSSLKVSNVNNFGRFLWNMPDLQHRRVGGSKQYLVKKKE